MTSPIEILDTVYGKMLVNKNDINQYRALKHTARAIDHNEIVRLIEIAATIPPPFTFFDVGACFGTYTLALAPHVAEVHTFEPQRSLAHCIAGSVALNDLSANVRVHNLAIGRNAKRLEVPKFDYHQPLNFGSIEFGQHQTEPLTQPRQRYEDTAMETIKCFSIDDLSHSYYSHRLGLLKIDAEGMDMEILRGALNTIRRANPIIFVEFLKNDREIMERFLIDLGYIVEVIDMNFLCRPK